MPSPRSFGRRPPSGSRLRPLSRMRRTTSNQPDTSERGVIHAAPRIEPLNGPEIESVELRLGLWLAPLAHRPSSPLLRYLEQAREAFNDDLGVDLPPFDVTDDSSLGGETYVLAINGEPVTSGTARIGTRVIPNVAGATRVGYDNSNDALEDWSERAERHRLESASPHLDEPAAVIVARVVATLRDTIGPHKMMVVGSVDALLRTLENAGGPAAAPTLTQVRQRVNMLRSMSSTKERRVSLDGP